MSGMETMPMVQTTSSGGSGNSLMIIGLFVLIFILYMLYQEKKRLEREKPLIIDGSGKDGKTEMIVDGLRILPSKIGVQFSYTFWMYIDDLNYKYGKPKHILHFGNENNTVYCPAVWIYPEESNLYVRINSYFDTNLNSSLSNPLEWRWRVQDPCDVNKIDIQRWVCVGVVLNNKTLDVYVDGELKRSCELNGVVKIPQDAKLYINRDGGFSGRIANLRYYTYAVSSSEMASINSGGFNDWKLIEKITSITSPVRLNITVN